MTPEHFKDVSQKLAAHSHPDAAKQLFGLVADVLDIIVEEYRNESLLPLMTADDMLHNLDAMSADLRSISAL
jgi:hypothetical protein